MTLRTGILHLLLICPIFGQNWTKADTAWEAACVATIAVDWLQTLQIARYPNGYEPKWHYAGQMVTKDGQSVPCYEPEERTPWHERNPLLPRHPSVERVNNHFLISVVGHVLIARGLPAPWRRCFQAGTVALELSCIAGNYRLGIRARF